MPTASGGDIHFDVPLSNFAVSAFADGTTEFIADKLFPVVPVGNESDKYYIIEKGAFLRIPATLRARKTEAKRVEFTVNSEAYFVNNYALAADNALEDLANADMAVRLRENSTRLVVTGILRDQEVRVANLVTSLTNLGSGTTLSGTTQWSHPDSDPIADVNTAHAFIENNTGLMANTMMIDKDTLRIVRRHPILLDMFKYTDGGFLSDQQLREVFEVDNILVGRGVKENALEGGTSSVTTIWGNNAIIARIEPAISLQTATFGLRFNWTPPIFPAAFGVQRSIEAGAGQKKVEIVEAGYYQDEKIVASELAYGIASTIA